MILQIVSNVQRDTSIVTTIERSILTLHRNGPRVSHIGRFRLFSNANPPIKRVAPPERTLDKDPNDARMSDKRSIENDIID